MYRSSEFGFSIRHPSDWAAWDLVRAQGLDVSTVPADIWFNSNAHVTVLIPPLADQVVERWWAATIPHNPARAARVIQLTPDLSALRRENIVEIPISGSAADKHVIASIEYLIRSSGADYLVGYRYAGRAGFYEMKMRQTFEQMAASFQLTDRKYEAPARISNLPAAATAFDFPVDPPSGGEPSPWFASYNQQNLFLTNLSSCYGKSYSSLQHTAEDFFRPAGTRVFAVADGLVVYSEDASYPGAVVIIEHELSPEWQYSSGYQRVYSVYAHLDINGLVSTWSRVKRGQYIGRLLDQGKNTHLHFEIRTQGDMTGILVCPASKQTSLAGPGYTDSGIHPGNFGYLSPSLWIQQHRAILQTGGFLTLRAPRAD